jgi:hypothetical protein
VPAAVVYKMLSKSLLGRHASRRPNQLSTSCQSSVQDPSLVFLVLFARGLSCLFDAMALTARPHSPNSVPPASHRTPGTWRGAWSGTGCSCISCGRPVAGGSSVCRPMTWTSCGTHTSCAPSPTPGTVSTSWAGSLITMTREWGDLHSWGVHDAVCN